MTKLLHVLLVFTIVTIVWKLIGADTSNADNPSTDPQCSMFFEMLPPTEGFHIINYREFVGTAIPYDIAHHVYGGSISRLFQQDSDKTYNILFAESFNVKNVASFWAHVGLNSASKLKIYLASPQGNDIYEYLMHMVVKCKVFPNQAEAMKKFSIEKTTLDEICHQTHQLGDKAHIGTFDFIEYNGGISYNNASVAEQHLNCFHSLLRDDGVLGLTFFKNNSMLDKILSTLTRLQREDEEAGGAWIYDYYSKARNLVTAYLTLYDQKHYLQDEELLLFIIESGKLGNTIHRQSFLPSEVTDLLTNSTTSRQFQIQSWFPTAYTHPFEEVQNYNIRKYYSFGIPEEVFVSTMLPSFRTSLYATKSSANVNVTVNVIGRARITDEYLQSHNDNVVIMDRTGVMSNMLQHSLNRAANQMSTPVTVSHFTAPNLNYTFIVMPSITPSAALLSYKKTFQELFQSNIDFVALLKKEGLTPQTEAVNTQSIRTQMIHFLSFLEVHNMITACVYGNQVKKQTVVEQ